MKKIAINYSFDASERRVTLTDLVISLERLLLIVNATRNQIIYSLTGSGHPSQPLGAAVSQSSGNTLVTLAFDTSGFSDSDKLSIFYDDGLAQGSTSSSLETINGEAPAAWLKLGGGAVPVDVQGATINIGGNVTIDNEVEIKNETGRPVPVHETLFKSIADLEWQVPDDSNLVDVSAYPAGTVFAINVQPHASSNATHKLMSNASIGAYGWQNVEVTTAFSTATLTTLTSTGLYIWRKREDFGSQNYLKFACVSPGAGAGNSARAKIYAVSNPNFGLPIQVALVPNSFPATQKVSHNSTEISGTNKLPVDVSFPATQSVSATTSANSSQNPIYVRLSDGTSSPDSATVKTVRDRIGDTDVAAWTGTGTGNLNSVLKGVWSKLPGFAGALSVSTGTAPLVSAELLAQSTARRYLLFQNLSTASLHINFGAAASPDTLRIDAGASLVFESTYIPQNAIHMIGTTAGQKYVVLHDNP
jgi:hypothetical protein